MCVLVKEGKGDTILPEYKMWAFNAWASDKMVAVVHWHA
jgi:hypothetical protein